MVRMQSYLSPWVDGFGVMFRWRTLEWIADPDWPQFHDDILKDLKDMVQHPVLKKWLYLPEASEDFETVAMDIVEAIRINDPRFGIEPNETSRRKKKLPLQESSLLDTHL